MWSPLINTLLGHKSKEKERIEDSTQCKVYFLLPDRAEIIYRGAPSLQSKIAPNIINPPVKPTFFHKLVGYYPCKKCIVCLHITCGEKKTIQFKSTATNYVYDIKHLFNCATRHIVYLITCPCSKYVGRTIRSFSVQVNEHIANIKKGLTNHSVPKHYRKYHDPVVHNFLLMTITYHLGVEGYILEVFRDILDLSITFLLPFRMNIEWDINAFINQA